MSHRPVQDVLVDIRREAGKCGYRGAMLARKLGVNQSSGSRLLRGPPPKTLNKLMLKACDLLNVDFEDSAKRVRVPSAIAIAVQRVWDGSNDHAAAIAKMVTTLDARAVAGVIAAPKAGRRKMKTGVGT